MPESVADLSRCVSCEQRQGPGSRVCPNCGYSPELLTRAATVEEPTDRAVQFVVHWGEIKRVGLPFMLVLLTSFIDGIFALSFAEPSLWVLQAEDIALLAILFATLRAGEIGGASEAYRR